MTNDDLRTMAHSLPEVEEEITWGTDLTFRVQGKIFVVTGADENSTSACVKATPADQHALIDADPATYSMSAYVGRFGWVTVQLATVDPDQMRQLVIDAWRRTAPKRLVAAYDSAS